MGTAEKFCLRWNDFESNICGTFKELRSDTDFFDVTLVSGDEEQIPAHKVVLAACSPFFRRILAKNKHQNPLLFLKGVRHNELSSILDFIYHGEVNVAQEDLNAFLAVAEDLAVKGLTNSGKKQKRDDHQHSNSISNSLPATGAKKRKMGTIAPPPPPPLLQAPPKILSAQSVVPDHHQLLKSELPACDTINSTQNYEDENSLGEAGGAFGDPSGAGGDFSSVDPGQFDQSLDGSGFEDGSLDPSMALGADGNKDFAFDGRHLLGQDFASGEYFCRQCLQRSKTRRDCLRHIEAIHLRLTYRCPYCAHIIVTKRNLQRHIHKYHKAPAPVTPQFQFETFNDMINQSSSASANSALNSPAPANSATSSSSPAATTTTTKTSSEKSGKPHALNTSSSSSATKSAKPHTLTLTSTPKNDTNKSNSNSSSGNTPPLLPSLLQLPPLPIKIEKENHNNQEETGNVNDIS